MEQCGHEIEYLADGFLLFRGNRELNFWKLWYGHRSLNNAIKHGALGRIYYTTRDLRLIVDTPAFNTPVQRSYDG